MKTKAKPGMSHMAEMTNAQLRERVALLREMQGRHNGQLNNSLTSLASSFAHQDNISSFLPLYTSNIYAPLTVNFTLLTYLYKTHGILQTMIDEPVLDAFRDGLELTSKELGEEGIGELEDFAEEIGAWEALKSMLMWGALYGGAGLVINVGQDPEKPLDEKDLLRGNLEFYDADRWEFSGACRAASEFLFYGKKLDATRILTYGGKRAPRLLRATLNGWGMSEMERTVEDFNAWLKSRNVLYEILDEAKVDVYALKDYASTLMLPDGEATIRARIQATNQIKNFHNALILDKEDEYKVVSNTFSGLADVMRENRIGIACATRMPFSKLFGTTAGGGGLANSGQDDMENYNAMITSRVRSPARSIIRKMIRLMMFAMWGREYDFSFDFRPLRILSAREEEEIKTSKQRRYLDLYNARLLDSKEIGELLHKEKLVPIKTKAEQGLLPTNPEVPTAEEMFKPQGDEANEPGKPEDGAEAGVAGEGGEAPRPAGAGEGEVAGEPEDA
jgi:phage-related protein (TIGR01555 family)